MSKFRLLCSGLMLAAVALGGCGGGDAAAPPKVDNGVIVAVGPNLFIAVSRDSGANWEVKSQMAGLPEEESLMIRSSYVNGRYFAFGWKLFTSTDAVTFSPLEAPVKEWFGKVVYGEGIFLSAGGIGHVIESVDGLTWTKVTQIPDIPREGVRSAAYGGGRFAVAAQLAPGNNVVYVSSDKGRTWAADPSLKTLNVGFCDNAFKNAIECGESDPPSGRWTGYGYLFRNSPQTGLLERSADGVNYTSVGIPAVRDLAFTPPPA